MIFVTWLRGVTLGALLLFLGGCVNAALVPGPTDSSLAANANANINQTNVVIEIVAHPYWWAINYPDQQVSTANEVHIPAGHPVQLHIWSDTVTGGFWMDGLNVQINLLPNFESSFVIQAAQPGTFRAACADLCNAQTAKMALLIIADPPDAFDAWVAQERQIPPTPQDETLRRGQQAFLGSACVYCHTIKGSNATGTIGPDLTHLASRQMIGAGTLPNTRGNLAGWIVDAQGIKPGNLMPPVELAPDQLQAMLAYLESLK